jgi:hypothetical protein
VGPLEPGVGLRRFLEGILAVDYNPEACVGHRAIEPLEFVRACRGIVSDHPYFRSLARLGFYTIRMRDAATLYDMVDAPLKRIPTS